MSHSENPVVKCHPVTKLPVWHIGLYENEGENRVFVAAVTVIVEKEKTKKEGNKNIIDYSIFFINTSIKSLLKVGADPNSTASDLFEHVKNWKNFKYRDSLRFPHTLLKGHWWVRGGGPVRKKMVNEGAWDTPDDGEEDIDPNEEEREEIELIETKETKAVQIEPPTNRPVMSLDDGLAEQEITLILWVTKAEISGKLIPEHFHDMDHETLSVVSNIKTHLKCLHVALTSKSAFADANIRMLKVIVTNFKVVSAKKKEIELAKLSLKESLKTFKTLENQAQKSSESVSTLSNLEKIHRDVQKENLNLTKEVEIMKNRLKTMEQTASTRHSQHQVQLKILKAQLVEQSAERAARESKNVRLTTLQQTKIQVEKECKEVRERFRKIEQEYVSARSLMTESPEKKMTPVQTAPTLSTTTPTCFVCNAQDNDNLVVLFPCLHYICEVCFLNSYTQSNSKVRMNNSKFKYSTCPECQERVSTFQGTTLSGLIRREDSQNIPIFTQGGPAIRPLSSQILPGSQFWKIELCKRYANGNCPNKRPDCPFAHGQRDLKKS